MNATVVDKNHLACDSPPLDSHKLFTLGHEEYNFYNVSVSMDGDYVTPATGKFMYYQDPKMHSIEPWLGPVTGKTVSKIHGSLLN
jgi:hypothetical protein